MVRRGFTPYMQAESAFLTLTVMLAKPVSLAGPMLGVMRGPGLMHMALQSPLALLLLLADPAPTSTQPKHWSVLHFGQEPL